MAVAAGGRDAATITSYAKTDAVKHLIGKLDYLHNYAVCISDGACGMQLTRLLCSGATHNQQVSMFCIPHEIVYVTS